MKRFLIIKQFGIKVNVINLAEERKEREGIEPNADGNVSFAAGWMLRLLYRKSNDVLDDKMTSLIGEDCGDCKGKDGTGKNPEMKNKKKKTNQHRRKKRRRGRRSRQAWADDKWATVVTLAMKERWWLFGSSLTKEENGNKSTHRERFYNLKGQVCLCEGREGRRKERPIWNAERWLSVKGVVRSIGRPFWH